MMNWISYRLDVLRAGMWSGWRLSTSCPRSTTGPTRTGQWARTSTTRPPLTRSLCRRVTTPTIVVKRMSRTVRQRRTSTETPPRASPSNLPATIDSLVKHVEHIPNRSERTQRLLKLNSKKKDCLKSCLFRVP